jgi:serine/threonine-protein kinase RsbW
MTDPTRQNPPEPLDGPVEFACGDLLVRFDLELPGIASAISPVVERVLTIVNESGCAQGKEFEVEISLREALSNAVRYGCEHNPGKMIQVSVACDTTRGVLIVVRDPGPGFDPSQVPSPTVGECLYSNHGRGLYLINQLMDHVEHGRGGAEIRMIKRPAP